MPEAAASSSRGGGDFSSFFEMLFGGGGPRPDDLGDRWLAARALPGSITKPRSSSPSRRPPGAANARSRCAGADGSRKVLKVKVPAGVRPDQKIRLAGQGGPGLGGGPRGDLYLRVRLQAPQPAPRGQRPLHRRSP